MQYENSTRNQHYVSQAEQRLNAIEPVARTGAQRIYRFTVEDHEKNALSPKSARSVKISRTLSFDDLFTFDVSDTLRGNLEAQFQQYENRISEHSMSLIRKLAAREHEDLKASLLGLFVCKFLNFLRNPHCIVKVLNSLGPLPDYHFTSSEHELVQRRFLQGNRPHQEWLCSNFDITVEMYDRWLRALFLLMTPARPHEPNLLEQTIKRLFENHYAIVFVYNYVRDCASETCLLSDRGHTMSIQTRDTWGIDFNICRNAFARFVFADITAHLPLNMPSAYAEAFKRRNSVDVRYVENDIEVLAQYNINTIGQCARFVYSATRTVRT